MCLFWRFFFSVALLYESTISQRCMITRKKNPVKFLNFLSFAWDRDKHVKRPRLHDFRRTQKYQVKNKVNHFFSALIFKNQGPWILFECLHIEIFKWACDNLLATKVPNGYYEDISDLNFSVRVHIIYTHISTDSNSLM